MRQRTRCTYRPRGRLDNLLGLLAGATSFSRPDDPSITFTPDGVEFMPSSRQEQRIQLPWREIGAVVFQPGPIAGRHALCVYPVAGVDLDVELWADLPADQLFTGTGPDLAAHFQALFGTPVAVHWHHVRGPAIRELDTLLRQWTGDRLGVSATPPPRR